ncbi:TetR/AcrR family transcriptional regulator [Gordonia sp. NPDC127522]|uniref:TetR/AcrR family transcriptional regulator n=1 Tax=Gordonia sp. NPDC127522 TaxID=3345390 RepID=UPI0036421A01
MRSQERIVKATLELVADRGFEGVTVSAVADRAGVSRQTIYTTFATRENMLSQSLEALTLRLLDDLRAQLATATTLRDYVIEFVVTSRRLVAANPALMAVFRSGNANPLFHTDTWSRARAVTHEVMGTSTNLPLDGRSFADVADFVLHLNLSVMLLDSDRDDAELRTFLASWIRI